MGVHSNGRGSDRGRDFVGRRTGRALVLAILATLVLLVDTLIDATEPVQSPIWSSRLADNHAKRYVGVLSRYRRIRERVGMED